MAFSERGYDVHELLYGGYGPSGYAASYFAGLGSSGLDAGLGEVGDIGYDPGLGGFSDGPLGQAVVATPPASTPSIIDTLLSPLTSITGLSSMTLLLIGGGILAYVYRDKLFGKKSAAKVEEEA